LGFFPMHVFSSMPWKNSSIIMHTMFVFSYLLILHIVQQGVPTYPVKYSSTAHKLHGTRISSNFLTEVIEMKLHINKVTQLISLCKVCYFPSACLVNLVETDWSAYFMLYIYNFFWFLKGKLHMLFMCIVNR
jgi:hypothetical protein